MALFSPQKPPDHSNDAGAAFTYRPGADGSVVDVVNDYYWTLTPPEGRKEIPYIQLDEFEINTSTISNQFSFYTTAVGEAFSPDDPLSAYDNIFPKNNPTGFRYLFPFYNDTNFEVNTPEWTSIDTLEAAKKGVSDLARIVHPALGDVLERGADLATSGAGALLAANYPKVGIMDRPKLFQSHNFRSYTVKFPLYNTYNPDSNKPEWFRNRQLCELLVNQNLYNKLSFITGIPPVFYEVLIPGQHYSPATCVTNINIINRGNIRLLQAPGSAASNQTNADISYNVPDVYEINITFTDMLIPSKNLFQAINSNQQRVTARARSSGGGASPGGCWVAQEVYGINSVEWLLFRDWLFGKNGPQWLQKLYTTYGKQFAAWIKNKHTIKSVIKKIMDTVIRYHETKRY